MNATQRFFLLFLLLQTFSGVFSNGAENASSPTNRSNSVYVIPIREEIAPPLTYLVRRGVKEAMEKEASLIVLDMETNGGRLDVTEEIIRILENFPGKTVTFVNRKAFSAGAFIAVGTEEIYMAPQSVIGAAAPIMVGPGGGVEDLTDSYKAKMTSGVKALIRTSAEKNGHNPEVVDAMIDSSKELKIGDTVINEKGQILTLTNLEAEKSYAGNNKPLLSKGTFGSVDQLVTHLGFSPTVKVQIAPSGAEKLGFWLNKISPLLLIIGVMGIYFEMKTPGFGLPGTVGIIAFTLYFLGGFIAGITGAEWIVVFILGLGLVFIEIFVIPGTLVVGLTGSLMILAGLAMAMVDLYPGMGSVPTFSQLQKPLQNVLLAFSFAAILIILLSRFLLRAPMFRHLTSAQGSGVGSVALHENKLASLQGAEGVAISSLRPGGKIEIGDQILDALSQSEFIEKGRKVRVIGNTGSEVVVEVL